MTVSNTIRALAPTEVPHVGTGLSVGYSVRVRGALDVVALSDAFDVLRRFHPVHGSYLVADEHGIAISRESSLPSAFKVFNGPVEEVLHDLSLNPGRALTELHVVREGERANITLLTHHSVADGYHSLAVLKDLWSLYTDFVEGVPEPTVEQRGYPKSLEAMFADRAIAPDDGEAAPLPESPTAPIVLTGAAAVASPYLAVLSSVRCALDDGETRALVDLGHRERTTINSLVSAAIVLALSDTRDVPLSDIFYAFAVDLRSRISPPAALTDGTNILGIGQYQPGDGPTELVDIARAVGARLAADLADRSIHHAAFGGVGTAQATLAGFQQARASAFTTNWGKIPALRHPAALELQDFWPLFHYDPLVAPPEMPPVPPTMVVISSFDGRLNVDLASFAQDDADRDLMAAVRRRLLSVL
ncbi:phthiocerol/phthiodiolone dimycocerosyl transferase family protein [Nocardia altamirensis]|uniref:phthiocerol/phthiodiolone dimycocerosyl transferase family protein n=1 Tax=Nocardia altamirensis TaxID=472158 RepID=UPI00114CEB56|nr:hypothetical protein [Nocardia altamirensis]